MSSPLTCTSTYSLQVYQRTTTWKSYNNHQHSRVDDFDTRGGGCQIHGHVLLRGRGGRGRHGRGIV